MFVVANGQLSDVFFVGANLIIFCTLFKSKFPKVRSAKVQFSKKKIGIQ